MNKIKGLLDHLKQVWKYLLTKNIELKATTCELPVIDQNNENIIMEYKYGASQDSLVTQTFDKQMSSGEKADELVDIILEKFKDYKADEETENIFIGDLIYELTTRRDAERIECDNRENELTISLEELRKIVSRKVNDCAV